MRLWVVAGALAACIWPLTACSAATDSQITVFAAASLKVPFTQLGQEYESQHPGTTVSFNFAGSSDLVAQLRQGASADVLATADTATMDSALVDDLAESPTVFATNSMIIAVPADNPGQVQDLSSLAAPDLRVVICAPQVPCGAATQRVERASGVAISADSEEASVTDVLNKVSTGEADAGIVYVSDAATASGSVRAIPIPANENATNEYPVAVLREADDAQAGADFVELLTGPDGRKVLDDSGFSGPA